MHLKKGSTHATSFWCSLGLLANTFVIENFIDEMALKVDKNPVEFRLGILGNEETTTRISKVIEVKAQCEGCIIIGISGAAIGNVV